MNKNILKLLILLSLSQSSYSAFNGLTIHSRANCLGINESISWDWTRNHILRVESEHWFCPNVCHMVHVNDTGFEDTWRNAIVHWTEAGKVEGGRWGVHAKHWIREGKRERELGGTHVYDCSIYNGWWDRNK